MSDEIEKMDLESEDLVAEHIEQLKQLFPEVVTEGNGTIDFEKLRLILGDEVAEGDERYAFTWPGKRDAIKQSQIPSTATLRPCPEKSVDWDTTQNLYIEGDNLEVLKLLQHSYHGKVKMIYIDPPYNTGHDFVYKDTFGDPIDNYRKQTCTTSQSNADTTGRFHSNWCSFLYSRLKLARELLTDDGVLFISIDDNEQSNLKSICDEVFGESNFIGCAGRITKKSNNKGDFWAPNFDYILTYTKNRESAKPFVGGINETAYNQIEEDGPRSGERYQLVRLYMSSLQNRNPEQRFWIECPDGSKIIPPGTTFPPDRPVLGDGIWRWTRKTYNENKNRIVIKKVKSSNLLDEQHKPAKWNVFTKTYLNDVINQSTAKPNSFIEDKINQIGSHELNELGIPFSYAKPTTLIKYLIEVAQLSDGDIALDFFSGSGTTGHAVMDYCQDTNSPIRFMLVQIPEPCDEKSEAFSSGYKSISEIGEERIRRAGAKIAAEVEASNRQLKLGEEPKPVPDIGFRVLRLDDSGINAPEEMTLVDDVVKEDRSDEDIIFEMMLKWGLELTLPIEKVEVAGYPCYSVAADELICCMAEGLTVEALQAIADREPRRVFMLDSILTDTLKLNTVQIFKRKTDKTGVEIELRTV